MAHWGDITKRFVADANPNRATRHVHDLANEKPSCTLQSIQWAGHLVQFDTEDAAIQEGYVPCLFCMPYDKNAS